MRRIPQLDGLRALAVGLVIVNHVAGWFPGGAVGVNIFFVLSGYLITSLLIDEHEKTGQMRRGLFYARRALRLYPALGVMLADPLGAAYVLSQAAAARLARWRARRSMAEAVY